MILWNMCTIFFVLEQDFLNFIEHQLGNILTLKHGGGDVQRFDNIKMWIDVNEVDTSEWH